jgi:hypothetical protein
MPAPGRPDKLTPADLGLIGRARELADVNDVSAEFAPGAVSPIEPYIEAFGQAQDLLARLADLTERLAGEPTL